MTFTLTDTFLLLALASALAGAIASLIGEGRYDRTLGFGFLAMFLIAVPILILSAPRINLRNINDFDVTTIVIFMLICISIPGITVAFAMNAFWKMYDLHAKFCDPGTATMSTPRDQPLTTPTKQERPEPTAHPI